METRDRNDAEGARPGSPGRDAFVPEPVPLVPDEIEFEVREQTASSTKRIARNTIWNLVGFCAPMLVALFAIPPLISGLGKERFGLLSLVWMVIGYFGLFDLGLSRALTQIVAERLGRGRVREVGGVFWTANALMLVLGCIGGAILYGISPWLVHHALNVNPTLQPETMSSFRTVAFGLPLIVTTAGLTGTLEACHRFPLVNAIRIPSGAFTFIGPLLALHFSNDLYWVVVVLMAGRVAQWLIFLIACLKVVPGVRERRAIGRDTLRGLLGFGGWMTVSNVIVPLMIHIDRFLIGAIRTVGEVTYYVTSAEMVIKLLIVARAWVSVLFPTFAANFHARTEETCVLYAQSVRLLLAALFPVVLVIIAFAPEGLGLWLGSEYAVNSAPVMRWLSAGIFLYSLAFVPTALLQGIGRPDVTARLHIVEVPVYLALAWVMIRHFGIVGAAVAWVIRAGLDAVLAFALAVQHAPSSRRDMFRLTPMTAVSLALFWVVTVPQALLIKVLYCAAALAIFAALSWFWYFEDADRRTVLKHVRMLTRWTTRTPEDAAT